MTELELACFFAAWCGAARFKTAARFWREYAGAVARYEVRTGLRT